MSLKFNIIAIQLSFYPIISAKIHVFLRLTPIDEQFYYIVFPFISTIDSIDH